MSDAISARLTVTNNKLPSMEKAIRDATRQAVRETTEEAAEIARNLAPVDTGALKDSITTEMQGNQYASTGIIHVGVPYGIYQEMGTRYMAAQPFLAPAIDAVSQGFQEKVGRLVEQTIQDAPGTTEVIG